MQGLLSCFLAFLCLIIFSVIYLKLYRGKKYYLPLLGAFGTSLLIYFLIYFRLPASLFAGAAEPVFGIDLLNGVILLTLFFHSYWDFMYAVVFTGFSSNILVMLSQKGQVPKEEIYRFCQKSNDQIWTWRLSGLSESRYIEKTDKGYRLCGKGRLLASVVWALQRLLDLDGARSGHA